VPQYTDTLETMEGLVARVKPSPRDLIRGFLNMRMRTMINRRPYWIGGLKRKVIPIPVQYTTGQVTVTFNSRLMTGVDTNWPVKDVVNTTIPYGVPNPGAQFVTPASMTNIDGNSLLYVDGDGFPEAVPVRQINAEQFEANFLYPHDPNCTVWMSSLVHRQMRITNRNPIYNVIAVPTDSLIILDDIWGTTTQTGTGYQLVQMYITIATDVKQIFSCVDPLVGMRIAVNEDQNKLNAIDPYRASVGPPQKLAFNYKNACNNMTYELYPVPVTQRQLTLMYYAEPPDLVALSDTPPPFLDSMVIVKGAMADVLRLKMSVDDENVNLAAASVYEQQFESGLLDLVTSDESKAEQMFNWDYLRGGYGVGGADFWQSHDPDVFFGFV